MKVKDLQLKKKKYLVSFVEIDEAFTVSEDLILEYRLVRGKILDEKTFKSFKESVHQDKYRQKLLYYATYKPRTIREAKLYLDKYDVPESAKHKYIDQLIQSHILNDDLYAKNYIEEYSQYRMIGPNRIKFDLIKKGISQTLIDTYLPNYKQSLIEENINRLILKKVKSIKSKPMKKVMISLKTYLTNKGYDYKDVTRIIEKVKAEIATYVNEDDALQKDFDKYLQKFKRSNKSESFKNYLIPKLLQKGYAYPKILKLLEGVYDEDR